MKSTLSASAAAGGSAPVTNSSPVSAAAGAQASPISNLTPPRIDVVNNLLDLEKRMGSGEVGSVVYFNPNSKLARAAQSVEDQAQGPEVGGAQGSEDMLRMPDEKSQSKKALKEQARIMENIVQKMKDASTQNSIAARDVVEKFLYGDGAQLSKQKKAPVVKNAKPLALDNIAHSDNQKKIVKIVERIPQYLLVDEEEESPQELLKGTLGMHMVYKELFDLSLKCEDSIAESRVSFFDHVKKAVGNNATLHELIDTVRSSVLQVLNSREMQLQASHPCNSIERVMNFKLLTLMEPQCEGGYIGLIMAHITSNNFDAAFPLFRKLESCISSNPRESKVKAKATEAYYYLMQGIHELMTDRPKEAVKSFKESLKKDNEIIGGLAPSPKEEYSSKMRIYKTHYHIAKAVESKAEADGHYNKVIKGADAFLAVPENTIKEGALAKRETEMAFFIKGVCLQKIRNYTESVKALDELLKINPNDVQGLVAQSENYLQGGQFVKCREYALQAEGLLKDGIVDANRGIDVDDMQFMINMRMARAHLHEGNFKAAVVYGHKLLEKDPDSASGLDTLAKAYCTLEEYEKAIFYCKKILAKSPNEVLILTALADALYQTNKFDEALEYYMRVLPLKHESEESYDLALLRIGQIHFEKKDLEAAKEYLEKCDFVIAQNLLATIYCHQDEPEKALAIISLLSVISPEDEDLKSDEVEVLKLVQAKEGRLREERELAAEAKREEEAKAQAEQEAARAEGALVQQADEDGAESKEEGKVNSSNNSSVKKKKLSPYQLSQQKKKAKAAEDKAKREVEADAKVLAAAKSKKAVQTDNGNDDTKDSVQDDNGLYNNNLMSSSLNDGQKGVQQTLTAPVDKTPAAAAGACESKGGEVDVAGVLADQSPLAAAPALPVIATISFSVSDAVNSKTVKKGALSAHVAAFKPSESGNSTENVHAAGGSELPAAEAKESGSAASVVAMPQSYVDNAAPFVHSGHPYENYNAPMAPASGQWVYDPYNNAYVLAGAYSMSYPPVHPYANGYQAVDPYTAHQQMMGEMAYQMHPGAFQAPPPAYEFEY